MNRGLAEEPEYKTPEGMQGINLSLELLKQDVIEPVQDVGHTVGVWYIAARTEETNEVYELLFGKTGNVVDLFYSDRPLEAMKARDQIQSR